MQQMLPACLNHRQICKHDVVLTPACSTTQTCMLSFGLSRTFGPQEVLLTVGYVALIAGPVPESVVAGVIPPQGHAARGVMQMVLLSALWGIATASR